MQRGYYVYALEGALSPGVMSACSIVVPSLSTVNSGREGLIHVHSHHAKGIYYMHHMKV